MSERKVLSKYYPPDFDPAALSQWRKKGKSGKDDIKTQVVRVALPFTLRCTSCGEFMYRGRKFNARKEVNPEEKYLDVQMVRITMKCTRCSTAVTYRTDPKNGDYTIISGALRNMEPWRNRSAEAETDDQRLDRLEREEAEEAEEGQGKEDTMADLEARHSDARREMEAADALDAIRQRNARIQQAERQGFDVAADARRVEDEALARRQQEEEEELEAELTRFRELQSKIHVEHESEEPAVEKVRKPTERSMDWMAASKRKAPQKNLMPGLIKKRKAEEEPAQKEKEKETKKPKPSLLVDYDSDND
jgi:ribosomal protein L33